MSESDLEDEQAVHGTHSQYLRAGSSEQFMAYALK